MKAPAPVPAVVEPAYASRETFRPATVWVVCAVLHSSSVPLLHTVASSKRLAIDLWVGATGAPRGDARKRIETGIREGRYSVRKSVLFQTATEDEGGEA